MIGHLRDEHANYEEEARGAQNEFQFTFTVTKKASNIFGILDKSSNVSLIPNAAEELGLTNVFDELKKFESVSKELQKDTSNKMISRLLFDELLQGHPNLQQYLSRDSEIVHSPVFKTAISKYQSKEGLSPAEGSLLQEKFASNSQTCSDSEASTSFAERILAPRVPKFTDGEFGDLSWNPTTSNVAERCFSQAKYYLNPYRKSILPMYLESQLFLMANEYFGM